MKKKKILISIIFVIALSLLLFNSFYVKKLDVNDRINNNGDFIIYSPIPYYGYDDGCGNILNNSHLSVSDIDEKIEEYIGTIYRVGDFYVSDYKDGICINRYVGNESSVEIPEQINGKNVIKIGIFFERSLNEEADGINCSAYYHQNAFEYSKIESVYLPKTIKEIVRDSFYYPDDNTLKRINVNKENPYYFSIGGVLFSKKTFKVLCIPGVYYLRGY